MSPVVRICGSISISFPRVSGDEPLIAEGGNQDIQFSPRERG